MKKFLVAAMIFGSIALVAPSAQASTVNALSSTTTVTTAVAQPGRWRRSRTYTRTVRVGRRIYHETYRVTYRPNGRSVTRLISRVRIR